MTATVSRYVAHRVSYLARFPSTKRDGAPYCAGREGTTVASPWKRGRCSACGEPVWFQPENLEPGMALVCWPCAHGVCA